MASRALPASLPLPDSAAAIQSGCEVNAGCELVEGLPESVGGHALGARIADHLGPLHDPNRIAERVADAEVLAVEALSDGVGHLDALRDEFVVGLLGIID